MAEIIQNLVKIGFITPQELMAEFIIEKNSYNIHGGWKHAFSREYNADGWKIHIYADSQQDWANISCAILPYLHLNRIYHKTIIKLIDLEALTNCQIQKGKAYTVYSPKESYLKQVILDLDEQLIKTGLERNDKPLIFGDMPIGKSNRIFYRYDRDIEGNYRLNDGIYKPEEISDPFKYFFVEQKISSLEPGEELILGRENFGSKSWPISVSRTQVKILKNELELIIEDMNSTNGTLVNNFRINRPTKLSPWDIIQFPPDVELLVLRKP
jgi:hypothetical protein